MKRLIVLSTLLLAFVAFPSVVLGDLIGDDLKVTDHSPTCMVVSVSGGYAVECAGKLSGLGSQTTDIQVVASFFCTNRGGNNPPGQVSGESGPIQPDNGQVTYDVTTSAASCPDYMTPTFGPSATINVYKDGVLAFTEQVPISQ
jgi:hypothetical protein